MQLLNMIAGAHEQGRLPAMRRADFFRHGAAGYSRCWDGCVDSGLPDFRGNEGLWNHYPALGKREMNFADIANPAAFHEDPKLAWGFYGHRLNLYRETIPHQGFEVLREIGSKMPDGMFVFTSNVDGQFQKAGYTHHL